MKGTFILAITYLLASSAAFQAVPLLMASHRVVPGLKSEISGDNSLSHNVSSVTNMLKKLVTQCSSDEYVLINQPGLTYEDLQELKKEDWPFLRKYLVLASTLIGLPWVDEPINLDYLEKYIIHSCDAETINVAHDDEDEVVQYYDTRTRVIRINLSKLPMDRDERVFTIREHDNLIRKIIRKLPSPHYTIILTSDEVESLHPVPPSIVSQMPQVFEIFNDIVNDPSRKEEIERNLNFHEVQPDWIDNKHTNNRYLHNKKKDEIHLFDYELWSKNEKLVTTIFVMIVSLLMFKSISLFNNYKASVIKKKSTDGLLSHSKEE